MADTIKDGEVSQGISELCDLVARIRDESTRLLAQRDALNEALKLIRFKWAGHSEVCVTVLHRSGKCDCDWPMVRDKCDAAIAQTEGRTK